MELMPPESAFRLATDSSGPVPLRGRSLCHNLVCSNCSLVSHFNPYPTYIFLSRIYCLLIMSVAYIYLYAIQTYFIMEAIYMNPDPGYSRNKLNFWSVHGNMSTSGLLQSNFVTDWKCSCFHERTKIV